MTRAPFRPGAAKLDLLSVPSLDLRSEPEAWSTPTEVDDRTRHVLVPVEILAHGVAMRKAEDSSNVVRVDQIVEKYAPGHQSSL